MIGYPSVPNGVPRFIHDEKLKELDAALARVDRLRVALVELDTYIDFSTPWVAGDSVAFKKVEGVNAAMAQARAALAE